MNEYGGCLYFEPLMHGGDNKGYWDKYNPNKVDVDSGRSAIQYILEKGGYKKIWLPIYNCPLVESRIVSTTNIEIKWYNLNCDFSPQIDETELQDEDIILWVNYCGVMPQQLIDRVCDIQNRTKAHIIIDNIPAYFSEPREQVYNIYSCRKFLGVPDGGHIIKAEIEKRDLPTYSSAENYLYLLQAFEEGSNSAYPNYLISESRFKESNIAYGMPKLTKQILKNIDYAAIKAKRKENFDRLHQYLSSSNRMEMDVETTTPSVYPYLTSRKDLREKLLNNHVYVSRFWKSVLSNGQSNAFERDLSEYLIPLPIDQRYTLEDIDKLANMVLKMER